MICVLFLSKLYFNHQTNGGNIMCLVDQFIILVAKVCIVGVAGGALGVIASYGAICAGLVQ